MDAGRIRVRRRPGTARKIVHLFWQIAFFKGGPDQTKFKLWTGAAARRSYRVSQSLIA